MSGRHKGRFEVGSMMFHFLLASVFTLALMAASLAGW